ncbi:MAG TPA: hypothetical protein VEK84_07110 [Terriglobales bacterium]|nr:hypothetical protein [Terriglobales bacterium]
MKLISGPEGLLPPGRESNPTHRKKRDEWGTLLDNYHMLYLKREVKYGDDDSK